MRPMSVTTRYFELKNEQKLPPSGRFIDPYDNTIYKVQPQDKLSTIVQRVTENRRNHAYPEIDHNTLTSLVSMTLAETCSDSDLRKYFKPKATIPQVSQILSFAKAVAYETVHKNSVSIKDKQGRAQKCLKCPFHKSRGIAPSIVHNLPIQVMQNSLSYPEEKHLGLCGLCGCGLQAKINFQVMGILTGLLPEQLDIAIRTLGASFFDKCWIAEEALQSLPTKKLLQVKLSKGNANGDKILSLYITSKIKSVTHGK
jgi:hypothetical protein